jgi:PhzF family phenazine biosynthesis protein
MGQTVIQVDAFTDQPFAGNPAAVCVLPAAQDAAWMQQIAMEMNLSETAFLVRQPDGFNLRWFTPTVEVNLCGHATLASAHVLWTEGHLPVKQEAQFHTKSGLLTAKLQDDWIELNFPAKQAQVTTPPDNLLKALGVSEVKFVGKSQFDYLVEVASERELRQLQPDFTLLKTLPVRGIIVTSLAAKYDFVSRFFAPGVGVDEDPVTGSAHCCLAPYWQERLGKSEFLAYQASARGGILKVRCEGDRVILGGQAVTVMRGELL